MENKYSRYKDLFLPIAIEGFSDKEHYKKGNSRQHIHHSEEPVVTLSLFTEMP